MGDQPRVELQPAMGSPKSEVKEHLLPGPRVHGPGCGLWIFLGFVNGQRPAPSLTLLFFFHFWEGQPGQFQGSDLPGSPPALPHAASRWPPFRGFSSLLLPCGVTLSFRSRLRSRGADSIVVSDLRLTAC